MDQEQELPEGGAEEETPELTFDAQAEAALDAAIDAMDPHDDDDEEDRAPQGKAKIEDDEPEEEEETVAEDDDEEGEPEEAAEGDEGETEGDEDESEIALHRAMTTLHDEGVPASVLKRTPKEKLIAWAATVEAKRTAASGAETSDADSKRESSNGAKTGTEEPAQAALPDWATVRKGIAKSLGVDEDSVEGLKYLHDGLTASLAEAKEARTALEAERSEARAREGREVIDRNVRRLMKVYPQLKRDPAAKDLLMEQAVMLRRGGLAKERELFDKAGLLAFGKPKRSDMAQLRRNGTSTPPTMGKGRMQPLTEDEYYERALDFVDAGRKDLIATLKPPPQPRRR